MKTFQTIKTLLLAAIGMGLVIGLGLVFKVVELPKFAVVGAPQVEDRTRVLQQIQAAAELTAYKYSVKTEIPVTQSRAVAWGIVEVQSNMLYLVQGTVTAGVDMSQAKQGADGAIEFPPAQIFDVILDVEESKAHTYDQGILNLGPDVMLLREVAESEAVKALRQTACEQGILEKSRQKAISRIAKLTNLAPSQITIPPSVCP